MKKPHRPNKPQPTAQTTDSATDQPDITQHSSHGHFDELAQIERFRVSHQAAIHRHFETVRATSHPAGKPYLRRASHRR